ncbi:major extracellular beta-xylosidase [Phaeosphaeriaceae sp. SRC1lsM3a]|nr:major extracellular beta-xylosidase [Stagonospora sp. SRC1lsM3a]
MSCSVAPYEPPVINTFHQADPAAHVWSHDPDTVYIYGSHDWNTTVQDDGVGGAYDMKDYYVLMQTDINEPAKVSEKILDLPDIPWATKQLWAPDAAEKDGKFYLFFPAKDNEGLFRIGVAISDTPDGKFEAEPSYIPGSYSIDPAVLEEDGCYYLYFGGISGGQLQAYDSNNVFNASAIGPDTPTSGPAIGPRFAKLSDDLLSFASPPKELTIYDKDGAIMQANSTRRFFEGPSINKVGKHYYLQYSTGTTHTIDIAVGDKPDGPFYWKSTLLQEVKGWTTHESIVKFEDEWLLYYADAALSGQDNLRNTKVRKLDFKNGTFTLQQPQVLQPSATPTARRAKRFSS